MNKKLLQQRTILFLLTIAALTPSIVRPMKRPGLSPHEPQSPYEIDFFHAFNKSRSDIVNSLKELYYLPQQNQLTTDEDTHEAYRLKLAQADVSQAYRHMNELTQAAHHNDVQKFKELANKKLAEEIEYPLPNFMTHTLAVLLVPTFIATNFGYTNLLHYFAENYPSLLEEKTEDGYSLLHIAAQSKFPKTTQFLLNLVAKKQINLNINEKNSFGLTPAHLAELHNKTKNIKLFQQHRALVEKHADKNNNSNLPNITKKEQPANTSQTSNAYNQMIRLAKATHEGNIEKFDTLTTTIKYPRSSTMTHANAIMLIPAFIAVHRGDIPFLQYLAIKHPVLLQEKTKDGYSLLHIAAQGAFPKMTYLLLELNAQQKINLDINAETNLELTPIQLATSHNRIENIKFFLKYGASIERSIDKNSEEDLIHTTNKEVLQYYPDFYAVATGNLDLLRYILATQQRLPMEQRTQGGINGKITEKGLSLLHLAKERNYPEITNFLLKNTYLDR